MNEMDDLFESLFKKEMVPLFEYLKAKRVDHIPHWINPIYLYYFDASL
jgi:hypothetical protein